MIRQMVAAAGFALFAWAGANLAGICVGELRILSTKQFIDAAIDQLLIDQDAQFRGSTQRLHGPAAHLEPYGDARTFLAENPECCRIERLPARIGDGIDGPSLVQRAVAAAGLLVIVDYDERVQDRDMVQRSRQKYIFHPTNCGKPSRMRF